MSTQPKAPRQQFFVDCEVQSAILARASIYAIAMTLYFAITLICTQWMNEPELTFFESLGASLEDVVYWLPGLMLFTPIAAYDLLKMTNHFAGPITRLRREMMLLVNGKSDRPLNFRDGDYWTDLTTSYNQIRGELLLLRKRLSEQEAGIADLPPSLITNGHNQSVRPLAKTREPLEIG